MRAGQAGHTLVELGLVLATLGICAALAVPAMGSLLERHRATAAMDALATQLQLARMAAITYRQPAVLCPSSDGTGCDGLPDWSGGWLLFLDADGNRQPDAGEEVIRVERAPTSRHLRVLATAGRRQVRYTPDGRSAGSNVTISVCGADGLLLGAVIVNNMGRPRRFRPVSPQPCPD